MKKLDFLILSAIIIIAFALRMYNYNAPLSDLHSWRQADTAAVARNFARNGFDLLHPTYDDLTPLQSGLENPKGLRYVEFPIYNATFALLYKLFGFFAIEVWGRIVTALSSLVIIGILYYLALKESNRVTAVFTAGTYAIFPFFVFFSRVVLPETSAVMCMFLSIYTLYLYTTSKNKKFSVAMFIISVSMLSLSALVKPTVVFYAVALIYLFVRHYRLEVLKKFQMYLFFGLSVVPFLAWRYFISAHPEAVPASAWLITTVNTYAGPENVFFKPAFFRWIFFERLNVLILGGYLSPFFVVGIMAKAKKYFLHSILGGAALYLFTFQGGNVQHEYYQTIILPAVALFVGIGVSFLFVTVKNHINVLVSGVLTFTLFGLSLFFSYYHVKDFYHNPTDLNQIASLLKTFTQPEDKIITDRLGDTTLLYMADRKGSPAIYKDIGLMKDEGYSYVYSNNKDAIAKMKELKGSKVLFENENFAIVKL